MSKSSIPMASMVSTKGTAGLGDSALAGFTQSIKPLTNGPIWPMMKETQSFNPSGLAFADSNSFLKQTPGADQYNRFGPNFYPGMGGSSLPYNNNMLGTDQVKSQLIWLSMWIVHESTVAQKDSGLVIYLLDNVFSTQGITENSKGVVRTIMTIVSNPAVEIGDYGTGNVNTLKVETEYWEFTRIGCMLAFGQAMAETPIGALCNNELLKSMITTFSEGALLRCIETALNKPNQMLYLVNNPNPADKFLQDYRSFLHLLNLFSKYRMNFFTQFIDHLNDVSDVIGTGKVDTVLCPNTMITAFNDGSADITPTWDNPLMGEKRLVLYTQNNVNVFALTIKENPKSVASIFSSRVQLPFYTQIKLMPGFIIKGIKVFSNVKNGEVIVSVSDFIDGLKMHYREGSSSGNAKFNGMLNVLPPATYQRYDVDPRKPNVMFVEEDRQKNSALYYLDEEFHPAAEGIGLQGETLQTRRELGEMEIKRMDEDIQLAKNETHPPLNVFSDISPTLLSDSDIRGLIETYCERHQRDLQDFSQACTIIRQWIERCDTTPVDTGKDKLFDATRARRLAGSNDITAFLSSAAANPNDYLPVCTTYQLAKKSLQKLATADRADYRLVLTAIGTFEREVMRWNSTFGGFFNKEFDVFGPTGEKHVVGAIWSLMFLQNHLNVSQPGSTAANSTNLFSGDKDTNQIIKDAIDLATATAHDALGVDKVKWPTAFPKATELVAAPATMFAQLPVKVNTNEEAMELTEGFLFYLVCAHWEKWWKTPIPGKGETPDKLIADANVKGTKWIVPRLAAIRSHETYGKYNKDVDTMVAVMAQNIGGHVSQLQKYPGVAFPSKAEWTGLLTGLAKAFYSRVYPDSMKGGKYPLEKDGELSTGRGKIIVHGMAVSLSRLASDLAFAKRFVVKAVGTDAAPLQVHEFLDPTYPLPLEASRGKDDDEDVEFTAKKLQEYAQACMGNNRSAVMMNAFWRRGLLVDYAKTHTPSDTYTFYRRLMQFDTMYPVANEQKLLHLFYICALNRHHVLRALNDLGMTIPFGVVRFTVTQWFGDGMLALTSAKAADPNAQNGDTGTVKSYMGGLTLNDVLNGRAKIKEMHASMLVGTSLGPGPSFQAPCLRFTRFDGGDAPILLTEYRNGEFYNPVNGVWKGGAIYGLMPLKTDPENNSEFISMVNIFTPFHNMPDAGQMINPFYFPFGAHIASQYLIEIDGTANLQSDKSHLKMGLKLDRPFPNLTAIPDHVTYLAQSVNGEMQFIPENGNPVFTKEQSVDGSMISRVGAQLSIPNGWTMHTRR